MFTPTTPAQHAATDAFAATALTANTSVATGSAGGESVHTRVENPDLGNQLMQLLHSVNNQMNSVVISQQQ